MAETEPPGNARSACEKRASISENVVIIHTLIITPPASEASQVSWETFNKDLRLQNEEAWLGMMLASTTPLSPADPTTHRFWSALYFSLRSFSSLDDPTN